MSGNFLAEFEMYVMLAVTRLGEDAYGASIRREIEERTGRPVSVGALYATLGRLGDKGYLSFTISDPTPVQGGRARKYCTLTEEGVRTLEHSTRMLGKMMEGVSFSPVGGDR